MRNTWVEAVARISGTGHGARMDDPHLHLLGNNIRRLRKKLHLTQEEFAGRAGVNERHFQDIEGGKVKVEYPTLRKIRRALGCDWNTLMAGSDEDGEPAMGMAAARAHA